MSATLSANVFDLACPTREALDLIADNWSALLVARLGKRAHRFNELRRTVGGISPEVLAERLRDLERDGIIYRTVYESVPPSVEYSLTPLGRSLHAPLDAVAHWAERRILSIHAARAATTPRVRPAAGKSLSRVATRRASPNSRSATCCSTANLLQWRLRRN